MVSEYAEEQHYAFLGPVTVEFERDDELETGRFRVRSSAVASAVSANRPNTQTLAPATAGRKGAWLELGASTYPLRSSTTRIGRGADSDLRIDDPGISRHHAEIRQQGGDVVIADTGSTNGIVIDGKRVEQARLVDGMRIMLGNTTVVFHAGPR
jgi:predicted component of type VI protein secretion system